jgi:hypothetical protein
MNSFGQRHSGLQVHNIACCLDFDMNGPLELVLNMKTGYDVNIVSQTPVLEMPADADQVLLLPALFVK